MHYYLSELHIVHSLPNRQIYINIFCIYLFYKYFYLTIHLVIPPCPTLQDSYRLKAVLYLYLCRCTNRYCDQGQKEEEIPLAFYTYRFFPMFYRFFAYILHLIRNLNHTNDQRKYSFSRLPFLLHLFSIVDIH